MANTRLGVALSGGGFRAAFFHLGVLRRLAELDLLRHVTTLSTVSGGSILAALYFLHFKKRFEHNNGAMSRDDYIALINDVEQDFIRGNRADLRNRLFMSISNHFMAILTRRSYGEAMAGLYAKFFYNSVTRTIDRTAAGKEGIVLHDAIVELPDSTNPPANRPRDRKAIGERFPSSGYPGRHPSSRRLRDINQATIAKIPRLILNATCLNTGGRFTFMLNEVGGPNIAYVRIDEVFMLLQYKTLLFECSKGAFDAKRYGHGLKRAYERGRLLQKRYGNLPQTAFEPDSVDRVPEHTFEHIGFYLSAKALQNWTARPDVRDWRLPTWRNWKATRVPVVRLLRKASWPCVEALLTTDFGSLRRAKVAAWYLLDLPPDDPSWAEYEEQFRDAVAAIHPRLPERLGVESAVSKEAAELILDLYYFRSAEAIDRKAAATLARLTLPGAVAASANFPPVFTPYRVDDLFEREVMDFVALTDGGINDNQGIDALLEDGCDYIIASDAGGLVLHEPDPDDSRLPMMDRIIEILIGGLRDVQMRSIALIRQNYRLKDFVHFHITSAVDPRATPLPNRHDRQAVAGIRTDLDSFSGAEIAILTYEGYRVADAKVRHLVERVRSPFHLIPVPGAVSPTRLPDIPRSERILRGAKRRVGRFSDAHPVWAALFALITATLLYVAGADTYLNIVDLWANDDLALPARILVGAVDELRMQADPSVALIGEQLDQHPFMRVLHAIGQAQSAVGTALADQSIAAWSFGLWALFILVRAAYRGARLPSWELLRAFDPLRPTLAATGAFLARATVIISAVCLIGFLVTVQAKWLLGIVPLWSIPIALTFRVQHHVFTPLWKIAGWMPSERVLRRYDQASQLFNQLKQLLRRRKR